MLLSLRGVIAEWPSSIAEWMAPMLDNPEKTARLLAALKQAAPFEVELPPMVLKQRRADKVAAAYQTRQTVSDLSYLGDEGGIMCHIVPPGDGAAIIISLTHLRAPARGSERRLYRHDLCGHVEGNRDPSQGLHSQVAPTPPPRHRLSGGSWRSPLYLYAPAAEPMAKRENNERDRTSARRVQAADQNADRAAIGRYGGDVVLGAARFRSDQHAQGRWLADACNKAD